MFVDQIKIFAKAGKGGDGSASFRRAKFVPKGGPDGGDGGRGGSIILRADPHVDTLTQFFYEPIIKAKNGEPGRGKQCYGKSAPDKIVKVPVGTLVYRLPEGISPFAPKPKAWELDEEGGEVFEGAPREEQAEPPATEAADEDEFDGSVERIEFYDLEAEESDEEPVIEEEELPEEPEGEESDEVISKKVGGAAANKIRKEDLIFVADLNEPGAEIVLCKGGAGGKGNLHFKSSRNRAPRQWTPGGDGEEGYFYLELRCIADAGLVGYPNAGKSTLLSKISSAHPKVAPYPFTTLHPIIGMVEFDGYRRAPVADIPGLIEGAHRNVGLGHEFLRHIMRCRVLLFVIDMSASEQRNPIEDLGLLRRELSLYDQALAERPWFVAANKMDDPGAEENLRHFRERFPKIDIVPISAELGEGIGELKACLAKYLFDNGD